MKTIYFIIILFVTYTSSAQDPRLFENYWYLQKVIIDGQDHFPPSPNEEVPYVPLNMAPDYLETSVCDTGDGAVEYSLIDSSFFFTHGMAMTLGNCYIPDNYPFQVLYFNDFFDSNYITQDDIFQYEVIETMDNMLQLTLTSPRGDQAIYGNTILAINDYHEINVAISPNPVDNLLYIKSNYPLDKMVIYDAMGRKIMVIDRMLPSSSVSLSGLAKGIYIVEISSKGKKHSEKFLKK